MRIVAATNRDLERAIAEGRFREDLYYRLTVFPIQLPPLRERREDIPLLVQDLIQRRQDELGRRIERVSGRARCRRSSRYAWPGNVRELGNVIERALILSRGPELCLDALPGVAAAAARCRRSASTRSSARTSSPCSSAAAGGSAGPGNAAEVLGMRPSDAALAPQEARRHAAEGVTSA